MASWLITVVGIAYLLTAVDLYLHGKLGLAIAFFFYAASNVGLYLAAR
jgi:hypothetical protein